jgi:exo-beta-1,3-glucanase (GH17 family)
MTNFTALWVKLFRYLFGRKNSQPKRQENTIVLMALRYSLSGHRCSCGANDYTYSDLNIICDYGSMMKIECTNCGKLELAPKVIPIND